jgi:biotin synthase
VPERKNMQPISRGEALELMALEGADVQPLLDRAATVRSELFGDAVRLCAISNAKSGRCPEHCDFCTQSVRFETDAPSYPMKDARTIADEARQARDAGAREFSIVTSGRSLRSERDIAAVEQAVRLIVEETGLEVCASLGELPRDVLVRLRDAGLVRYHHNVETAPSFHPSIVHTHGYEDEVRVVREARDVGLKVCCGGILGMGETREQRVEMAFAIREIDPQCVPLNFLDPRPGTPLADLDELTPLECLKIIAVFRLVMPGTHIFVCGGRERNLQGRQAEIFRSGATGTMVGDYLTTRGQPADEDRRMIAEAGFRVEEAGPGSSR